MEIRKYSVGQFAKMINRSTQTLRNWDQSGKLKPGYVDEITGRRYYTDEQLRIYNGACLNTLTVGYCRVVDDSWQNKLECQIDSVKQYMYARGYQFTIISDTGGTCCNNSGFTRLVQMILDDAVSRVVVLRKDRLIGPGSEIIETICAAKSVPIEVIDNTECVDVDETIDEISQTVDIFNDRLPDGYRIQIVNMDFVSEDDKRAYEIIHTFLSEFLPVFKWRLVPYGFLYSLYCAWMSKQFPQDIVLGRRTFIIKVNADIGSFADWTACGALPVHNSMNAYEPLIMEYNLEDWKNKDYRGTDVKQICNFEKKSSYRGIKRKAC